MKPHTHKPLEPQRIAVDVGNGTTVAVTEQRTIIMPSAFSTYGVTEYRSTLPVDDAMHHMTRNNRHVIVGAHAFDLPGADTVMQLSLAAHDAWKRYTNTNTVDLMLAAVCAAFPEAQTVAVQVDTGMPVSLLPHTPTVAEQLTGTYDLVYNGMTRRVIVDRVTIHGEGTGVFQLIPVSDRPGTCVHDIGSRTWSVISSNPRYAPRSYDIGLHTLLNEAGVPDDPAIRWNITTDARTNRASAKVLRSALVQPVLNALQLIENKVALEAAQRHVIVGGMATVIAPIIATRYRAPVTVLYETEPETINARSYWLTGIHQHTHTED